MTRLPQRRPVLGMTWVLVAMCFAAGIQAEERPPVLADTVAALLEAHAAGATDAIAQQAGKPLPDPFLVAEVLCLHSADAARAFAAAVIRQDEARLGAYVDARLASPPSESEVAQLLRAYEAWRSGDGVTLAKLAPGLGATVSDVALSLWRAEALRASGRDDAARWLELGRRARSVGWLVVARQGLYRGALAARSAGLYDHALQAFSEMGAVERERAQGSRAAQADYFAASLHLELGQLAEALAGLERAGRQYAQLGERESSARVQWLAARVHLKQGEYGRALVEAERGLEWTTRPDRTSLLLEESGSVHLALGQHAVATSRFEAALALIRPFGRPAWTAAVLGNLALARIYLGEYEAAEAALTEVRTVFEAAKDPRGIATALAAQAYLALRRGQGAASLALCTQGLAIAREIDDPWLIANLAHSRGMALQRLKRHAEALKAFDETIQGARDLGSRSTALDGHLGRAESLLALGRTEASLAAARDGIALVGRMVGGLAEGQDAEARAKHARLFEVAADAAARLDDAAAMTDVVEAGRAMALLASLEGREALRAQAIPDAHRASEAAARAKVAEARAQVTRATRTRRLPEIRTRRTALQAASAELDEVVARIRRSAKQQAALVYPEPDDLPTLQARLKPDEALVLYADGLATTYALVIEPKRARIVGLGAREAVDAACSAIAEAAEDSAAKTKAPLAALVKLVVGPLALPTGVRRVLVSPTGRLFLAPLPAALEDREVVYIPSGTTLGVLGFGAPKPGTKVLALGGVDYGDRPRLAALPGSALEAREVGHEVLSGGGATEAALRTTLTKQAHWRAVHFACHGLLDMARPMHTALALTRAAPDDGELTVEEIFGLRVSADLVALSACESGRGRIYRAEGIVGLTRGFMHAGAPRVLCSLWKVDDEATRALMEAFYAAWTPQGEMTAAAALRRAQAEIRAQAKWAHPYYWAAWVLWGLP